MCALKTQRNANSVDDFLNEISDTQKRADCFIIKEIMESITGKPAEMWGTSIVGFGTYTYKYATGRTGEWMITAFSPRKQTLTIYIMNGFKHYSHLLEKLGKHKLGKSCLYIRKLEDVDIHILKEIIKDSVQRLQSKSNN